MSSRTALDQLWNRGGFPDSFEAASDSHLSLWRAQFLGTDLERDIPQPGPRIPAETSGWMAKPFATILICWLISYPLSELARLLQV